MTNVDHSRLASAATAFSHPRRIMIFETLADERDGLWFETLLTRTKLQPSTLAHHLKPMVAAGLVERRRRGARVRLIVAPGPVDALDRLSGALRAAIRRRPTPRLASSRGVASAPEA